MKISTLLPVGFLLTGLGLSQPAIAGAVDGRVLDTSGNPVAGARVMWFAYRSEERLLLDETKGTEPAAQGEVKTGADGRFRLAIQKPGVVFSLRVVPDALSSADLAGPMDSADDTALPDLQLPPASKASGRVVDESGKPVPNARVRVSGRESFLEDDTQFFADTRTGADGSFLLANAPAGLRSLLVRAPGYVPATLVQLESRGEERIILRRGGAIAGLVVDASGSPVTGAVVTAGDIAAETDTAGRYRLPAVGPGPRHVQTIWKEDFAASADGVRVKNGEEIPVLLKLARAASLTGSVVEEKTKRPIAGVRIGLQTADARPLIGGSAERSARTDARGQFRVGGLANRNYFVEAKKDGFLPSSMPNVPVSLSRPGSAKVALRRAASVSGKTVDAGGQALGGVRVSVAQELNFRALRRGGLAAAASAMMGRGVLSGPDGAFHLRNIVPGHNLELEASKTGFATAKHPGVTLKPGDALQGMSLVLAKGLQATGKVVDGQGQPVSGAEIRLAFRESGARGMRAQFRLIGMEREKPDAVSRPDGVFAVAGLSPGQYAAFVSHAGFASKSVGSLSVAASGENRWPPITLSPGLAIAGVVQDSAGQAVPGARVFAMDPGAGGRPVDASTGPDGRFRIDGLAGERPLMLNVSADGHAAAQREMTPPVDNVTITLKSSGSIRGRVEDGDTKTPVTDFVVGTRGASGGGRFFAQLAGGGGGDKAFHAEDGSFELGDVPPGKWTVHVTAEGYRPADVGGVEVAEGATKEGVVLSIKRGGALTGRVLDPMLGTGVANANVSFQAVGTGGGGGGGAFARLGGIAASTNTTTTDADGHFSLDGISDGKILLTASHPDYLDVTQQVDTAQQGSVDLMLGTGGSISGSVLGQDGRSPVAGAQVSLNQEGDTQFGFGSDSTRADAAGSFLFDHLQAGRFKVIAQTSDGKTISQEVVLADGQKLTGVLLQMATGALLQGTVSGLPAGRLGGVRVSANGPGYNDSTTTDDSGKYSLSNVPAGVIRLAANTSFLSGRSTQTSVEIPDGAAQFTADIVFQGASRLAGRVTRGETALPGLFVNAIPTAGSAAGAGRASGQTDDSGQYALEGLSDGDYTVALSGQGVSYRKSVTVSGDTPGDIALPPIQLIGTITENGSGEPLDGASVQLQPKVTDGSGSGSSSGRFSTKAASGDSTGHYFLDDVDSGNYQVTARRAGYQAKVQTITVGGDSATLDFALDRGEGISIRVADGLTGLPLRGVIVAAVDGSGSIGFQGSVNLDSTGKGEIASLAPGRYAVHFSSDGYASRTAVLDAPSPLVPIALTPGGRVEIAVSSPLTGRVVDGSGLPYQMGPFRSDGHVSLGPPVAAWDHVAPGSYQLLVGPPGSEVPYPFSVVEGQTTRVTVN